MDVCGVGWEVESDGPYFEDDLLKGKPKDAPEVVFAGAECIWIGTNEVDA